MTIGLPNADYLERAIGVVVAKWMLTTPIHVQLVGQDDTDQELLTDEIAGALATIDIVHHEIHEGEYFTSSHVETSVGNGVNLDVRILTGAGGLHLAAVINAGGQCTVTLYENPTISGGNGMTVFNNYRAKGEANAPFQAFSAPTVTATGAALLTNLIAGGTSVQTRVGANARPGDEVILLPSRNYLLRINNSSGSSIAIGVVISGYAA